MFADGFRAQEGLARDRPHAVVIDIGLPGMDGYELVAGLRKRWNLEHTLLLVLSGFKRRTPRYRTGDDFDHYLVKPVDLDELLEFLESHVMGLADRPPGIMLVEDNVELAEVTEAMLWSECLDLKVSHSGAEAMEAAAEFQPQRLR